MLSRLGDKIKRVAGAASASEPNDAAGEAQGYWNIYVAVTRLPVGKYFHWRIARHDGIAMHDGTAQHVENCHWRCHDAVEPKPGRGWKIRHFSRDPMESPLFVAPLVFLGRVTQKQSRAVDSVCSAIGVPRDNPDWDCCTYVQEAMDALVGAGLVQPEAVAAAKTALEPFAGEMPLEWQRRPEQPKEVFGTAMID